MALTDETLQKIGAKVREARIKQDLTQKEVAELAGLNSGYYSQVERGEVNISVLMLERVTRVLKLKPKI